jgi:hypothetical protein
MYFSTILKEFLSRREPDLIFDLLLWVLGVAGFFNDGGDGPVIAASL